VESQERKLRRREVSVAARGAAVTLCLLGAADALAAAPAGRYSYPGGTVSTAVVVYDNVMKLTWQRTATAMSFTNAGAQDYCTSLNTSALGGYSTGWRMPTMNELLSIVDYRAGHPAVDPTAFPGTATTAFWASTPYSYNGSSGNAWVVDFTDGVTSHDAVGNTNDVRCVR